MSKGIVWGVVILVVVLGLVYFGSVRYDAGRVGTGEVYSNDPPAGRAKTGTTSSSSESPTNQIVVYPTPGQTVVSTTTPTDSSTASTSAGAQTAQPGVSSSGVAADAAPASDTVSPEPPNGMLFAGKGRYQLYRQGDITWRLDTNTGHTCIVFATDEQWKKPRVLKAGCGRS